MAIALSSPTLGKLITTVRNMLNQPDASNSFWSDAEITDYINEGVRVYFAEVVQNKEGQWTTTTDLNIVTDTETVTLPTNCYQVKTLFKAVTGGYVALPYQNSISDSYASVSGANGTDTYFPSYYFRENSIVLHPVPNYSETAGLRLEYVYFPEVLMNSGDTMTANVAPIFKQVVEMYAVYKAKVKESLVSGVDTSALAKQNLNELYKQFVDSIRNRSAYPQYIKAFNPEYT
jgi:DNA-binding ferritin-like protein (Dps family)